MQQVIALHGCPFLAVALEHSEVVRAVHRGLMEGALEQLQAPPATIRRESSPRPGICLPHLASAGVHGVGGVA